VLDYLCKGFTFAEAAKLLEVTPHTVATYVRRIYRKLAVRSRAEAVYEAQQLGLLKDR
jgi:DNA-binding NarL/FixJ family response regulator